MAIEIKLPALGDNISSGDVLEIKVHEGDMIQKDQGILEIETDKATVEVPSTHAGKVLKVHIKDGETINIGAPLITLEEVPGQSRTAASKPSEPASAKPSQPPAAKPAKPAEPASAKPSQPAAQPTAQRAAPAASPKPPAATERESRPAAAKSGPPHAHETSSHASSAKATSTPPAGPVDEETPTEPESQPGANAGGTIPAGPSVRRFAREVGVDLSVVSGSGPGGRIVRDDVLAVVRTANEVARSKATESTGRGAAEPSQRDAWGPVRLEKMPKIRKTIAAKMAESWSIAPRVTNFDDADVTELERIRQSSKNDYASDGIKLTSLPFVIKAVAMALKKHPTLNASIDQEQEQVIYKQYVHVGIAVDTDRGLVVPVLRHVDRLSIAEIARQVAASADKVRGGNFSVDDLRGSSFTISNLGAVGGTYSTPMINVPEVAILLVGRSRKMPVVVDDEVAVRLMMPLSLSYDHRLVDGAAAARFLNDVKGFLEAPSRLLLAP